MNRQTCRLPTNCRSTTRRRLTLAGERRRGREATGRGGQRSLGGHWRRGLRVTAVWRLAPTWPW